MKTATLVLISFFVFSLFVAAFCRKQKDRDCYDKESYEKHKDDICTMDCPGVTVVIAKATATNVWRTGRG